MKTWVAKTKGRDFEHRIGSEEFRVHSVFHSVCNLQAYQEQPLLSLVSREEARGPNSLWVESLIFADCFQTEMPVHLEGDILICGSVAIDCSQAVLHQPVLADCQTDHSAWDRVEAWVEQQYPGFTGNKSRAAENLEYGLLRGDRASLFRGLHQLIGAGEGLTPAGDDFVAGVLAAYVRGRHCFSGSLLPAETADDLESFWVRTTSISQTMLWYAAKGEGALYVTELIDAIYGADSKAVEHAARLWKVGASSGRHLLAGILLGCKIFWTREKDDGRKN